MKHNSNASSLSWWSILLLCFALLLLRCDRFLCFGCPVEEYEALLELRLSMFHFLGSSPPTWATGKDCCLWERVSCNNNTKRVSKLSLSELWTFEDWFNQIEENEYWLLDFSIFSPFHELQHLNLSGNHIAGSLAGIPRLKKLESLDLSSNHLTGSIPSSLRKLSSLTILNLRDNDLNGMLDAQAVDGLKNLRELHVANNQLNGCPHLSDDLMGHIPLSISNFTSLRHLDLSSNLMEGNIPPLFCNLLCTLLPPNLTCFRIQEAEKRKILNITAGHKLKKLESLDLSWNELTGSIPLSWGKLSSLTILNLACNRLNGTLDEQDVFRLKKLESLYLNWNDLTGSIPLSLGKLSSLTFLNLAGNMLNGTLNEQALDGRNSREFHVGYNHLNGSFPQSLGRLSLLQHLDLSNNLMEGDIPPLFSNLTSLQYLDLSNNYLSGHLSFRIFANNSKLETIILSNNVELSIDLNDGDHFPSFQLRTLGLSSCILEKQTLASPVFLSSQHKLEVLDLSHNNLLGNFPLWLLENQTGLECLILRNNSLGGPFHLPDHLKESIAVVDFSMNLLVGSLPANMGMALPCVRYVNFSSNYFIGDIPPSLGNMSYLEILDLSNNKLTGEIPPHLFNNCLSLNILKLSNNNLHGGIPHLHYGREIAIIYLDGNQFSGTIPSNWSRSMSLLVFDVHDNRLSGEIPDSFSVLTELLSLNLGGNHFKGQIPSQLCNMTDLNYLDVSDNNLSGSLPACAFTSVDINLAGNGFTGSIPEALLNSSILVALDASNNQLSGSLPTQIRDELNVAYLSLSRNYLEGPIPNQFCNLQSLQLLDLSHNALSGSLPLCFGQMQSYAQARLDNYSDLWTSETVDDGGYGTLWMNWADNIYKAQRMEFPTKGNSYAYQMKQLALMPGIDLSANKLTGSIPPEIGNLIGLISLNLSHNQLTGLIPETLSNLSQIESLDLSHNQLSGMIPWQLTQLKSLEVFSVAYNNLSGCTPELKYQFSTFNESSYVGNGGLHGPPMETTCASNSSLLVPHEEHQEDDDDDSVDNIIFYAISAASFIISFWVCIAFLHCNHIGRRFRIQMMDQHVDFFTEWIFLTAYKLKQNWS